MKNASSQTDCTRVILINTRKNRDCSSVTGADLRIARQEQGESTRDPLNDSESALDSANGSIPSLIAWTVPKPPGNTATVSKNPVILVVSQVA